MIHKYANEEKTILNVFDNGSLKKCIQRVDEDVLKGLGITSVDVEDYVEVVPIIDYEKLHTVEAQAYQDSRVTSNTFAALMGIKGSGRVGPKAIELLTWLQVLWDDKKVRVLAEDENIDYSNHEDAPYYWSDIADESEASE